MFWREVRSDERICRFRAGENKMCSRPFQISPSQIWVCCCSNRATRAAFQMNYSWATAQILSCILTDWYSITQSTSINWYFYTKWPRWPLAANICKYLLSSCKVPRPCREIQRNVPLITLPPEILGSICPTWTPSQQRSALEPEMTLNGGLHSVLLTPILLPLVPYRSARKDKSIYLALPCLYPKQNYCAKLQTWRHSPRTTCSAGLCLVRSLRGQTPSAEAFAQVLLWPYFSILETNSCSKSLHTFPMGSARFHSCQMETVPWASVYEVSCYCLGQTWMGASASFEFC